MRDGVEAMSELLKTPKLAILFLAASFGPDWAFNLSADPFQESNFLSTWLSVFLPSSPGPQRLNWTSSSHGFTILNLPPI
jgi:hypothetical protein